jgi:hypothetical protein
MPFKDELATLLTEDAQPPARDTQEQVELFAVRGAEGAEISKLP